MRATTIFALGWLLTSCTGPTAAPERAPAGPHHIGRLSALDTEGDRAPATGSPSGVTNDLEEAGGAVGGDRGGRATRPSPEPAADDPARFAADAVSGQLEADGLIVADVHTEVTGHPDGTVTVTLSVLHHPGAGHPHQSRYHLDLHPAADGWQITSLRELP